MLPYELNLFLIAGAEFFFFFFLVLILSFVLMLMPFQRRKTLPVETWPVFPKFLRIRLAVTLMRSILRYASFSFRLLVLFVPCEVTDKEISNMLHVPLTCSDCLSKVTFVKLP